MKQEIRKWLREQAEQEYREFSSSLIPGCQAMLGIRIPILRRKAKEIAKGDWRGFLQAYGIGITGDKADIVLEKERYFEEEQLIAMVLGYRKVHTEAEAGEILDLAAEFIPMIHDWSVNDTFCCGMVMARKYQELVWNFLMRYRSSDREFEQRVLAVMLMNHYLNDTYIDQVLEILAELRTEGYYRMMGVSWALATAYAKYPEKTMAVLQSGRLEPDVYRKAIQKMLESYRVPVTDKEVLRSMRTQWIEEHK